jgi:hypothetical protein
MKIKFMPHVRAFFTDGGIQIADSDALFSLKNVTCKNE